MSDPWDSLLDLEQQAYAEGVQEGSEEARSAAESRQQGVASG
jgi:hypothetical protein